MTGWETRPRIVRTLAENSVRCQANVEIQPSATAVRPRRAGTQKQIITVSPESPRNHSNHVDSNDGIKNVYHRTCLSYFERRRTRMFILLVKNKLVLCPQTSRSRTTNCVRFRDFLVFTAWRQKDARNGRQVQQSKQLRMIAVG